MKSRNLKSIILYNMTIKAIVMPNLQSAPVILLLQISFSNLRHINPVIKCRYQFMKLELYNWIIFLVKNYYSPFLRYQEEHQGYFSLVPPLKSKYFKIQTFLCKKYNNNLEFRKVQTCRPLFCHRLWNDMTDKYFTKSVLLYIIKLETANSYLIKLRVVSQLVTKHNQYESLCATFP